MTDQPSEAKELYTTAEAAELFSVKPGTIRRWIKNGKLRAIRLPGDKGKAHLRITRAEIKRFGQHDFGK